MPAPHLNLQIPKANFFAFSLIELMVSMALIAILTAAAIPSFNEFFRSQSLTQAFKSLKTDLRVAQSRSLSGATVSETGGVKASKAWGINFDSTNKQRYQIFNCNPVSNLLDYGQYRLTNTTRCPPNASFRNVFLSSLVEISKLTTSATEVSSLDVVFDSQSGLTVVNGSQSSGDVEITLRLVSGSGSPQVLKITQGGGIID